MEHCGYPDPNVTLLIRHCSPSFLRKSCSKWVTHTSLGGSNHYHTYMFSPFFSSPQDSLIHLYIHCIIVHVHVLVVVHTHTMLSAFGSPRSKFYNICDFNVWISHTHTHTHSHTHTHTCMHTTCTHTHAHIPLICTCTYIHTHTRMHTPHTHTPRTLTQTDTHAHTHAVPGSMQNWMEVAYGTKEGSVRVVVRHPENIGQAPQIFQSYNVHTCPILRVVLGEKHLISGVFL